MIRYAVGPAVFSKSVGNFPHIAHPTAQPDRNNSSMKKLVYILAAPATLLLAKSVEAADKQLEVGISTHPAPAAPYVGAQLQPAAPAAEKPNALASEWRNSL